MQTEVCAVKCLKMPNPLARAAFADQSLRMSRKTSEKSGLQKRLRYAMDLRSVGARELERALGGGNASISKTLTRANAGLSADRGRAVSQILHVRYEWLMWGEEPMDPGSGSSAPPLPKRTLSGVRRA